MKAHLGLSFALALSISCAVERTLEPIDGSESSEISQQQLPSLPYFKCAVGLINNRSWHILTLVDVTSVDKSTCETNRKTALRIGACSYVGTGCFPSKPVHDQSFDSEEFFGMYFQAQNSNLP